MSRLSRRRKNFRKVMVSIGCFEGLCLFDCPVFVMQTDFFVTLMVMVMFVLGFFVGLVGEVNNLFIVVDEGLKSLPFMLVLHEILLIYIYKIKVCNFLTIKAHRAHLSY